MDESQTVTEWAIEWTNVPVGHPDRFELRTNEAMARKWAEYWRADGARAVSRTVTRTAWTPAAAPPARPAPTVNEEE